MSKVLIICCILVIHNKMKSVSITRKKSTEVPGLCVKCSVEDLPPCFGLQTVGIVTPSFKMLLRRLWDLN